MPLKKYNTAGAILANLNPASATSTTTTTNTTTTAQMSPSPSVSTSTSSSPPEVIKYLNNTNQQQQQQQMNLATQMSSLVDAIEKHAAVCVSVSESSGSASDTISRQPNCSSTQLPAQIKTRLYALFCQIEQEFDALYAENMRLASQLKKQSAELDCSTTTNTNQNNDDEDALNETKTNNMLNSANLNTSLKQPSNAAHLPKSNTQQTNTNTNHTLTSSMSIPSGLSANQSITSNPTNIVATSSNPTAATAAKSALFTSKSRINNLSFPKFKPNAREFIMQSIKNTSAQIVNKTQNNALQSKLQCSLSGHTDGIWDINVQAVPSHLINNSNFKPSQTNINLLIGTASADSTARLWFLNSQPNQTTSNANTSLSSPAGSGTTPPPHTSSLISSGFCVQQYCGHSGSVNSLRFHPRFFTDATNLILTASGDCQAHIWQSVLSPFHDSLESTSDVVLNYSNCYSIATSLLANQPQQHQTLSPTSSVSPVLMPNSHYQELFSNIATIRSPIKRFEGHTDTLIAAEWFPDGEFIATGSWDRSANIYNVETGKILCNLQHDDYLTNINIHKTQKIILTSSKDCTFKIWDFRDPICSVNVYQGHSRSVNSAIFVNEDKIATSSDDQTLKLWDLRIMRSPLFTINVNSGVNRICTMTNFTSSDTINETLLCLPLDNRDIKIYNLQGERLLRLPRTNRVGHRRLVTSLASYSNLLLSASFDKQINCWSLDSNPSSKSSKLAVSNKENDQLTSSTSEQMSHLVSSPSANTSSSAQLMSCLNGQSPVSSKQQNFSSAVPPPLAHITNNSANTSTKGINSLSKFIKI